MNENDIVLFLGEKHVILEVYNKTALIQEFNNFCECLADSTTTILLKIVKKTELKTLTSEEL